MLMTILTSSMVNRCFITISDTLIAFVECLGYSVGMFLRLGVMDDWALGMTDLLTIKRAAHASWSMAQGHAARAALWSARHPFISLGLVYGTLAYLGVAVLINAPGRAIIALVVVGPAAWWCLGRYVAWVQPPTSRLSFFTWNNGPLRLNEDIGSSRIVYCIGVTNEGTKIAESVRVSFDSVEGSELPASDASLPIFRSPDSSVSLQPDESEYFCVMRRIDGAGAPDSEVALCCGNNPMTPRFPIEELADGRAMTLSAHSDGPNRTTAQIRISSKRAADATWSLHMVLMRNADETPAPAPAQDLIAAAPAQVREVWKRARTKLSELGERSFAQRGKTISARETSERGELPREPSEHRAIPEERLAPEVPAVEATSPSKSPKIDAIVKEASAQTDRVQRLLARQARVQMSKA